MILGEEYLAFLDGLEAGFFNPVSVRVELHMSQHHDSAEEQGGGIRQVLASDVWRCAVYLYESLSW